MGPGNFVKDPISAISFGMALMFGTAGLPHILMRFFTVPSAKAARTSVMWATGWIGYFYLLTFIIGFGAITFVLTNPQFLDASGGLVGGSNMAAVHLANAVLRHRLGWNARSHAVSGPGYWAKVALQAAWRRSPWSARTQSAERPIEFRLDSSAPGACVDLPSLRP